MNLTVLGAGAWGTALAVHASAAHPTRLWARDAGQAAQMRSLRRNARYLPEIALPPALQVTSDFAAAVRHARDGLIVVATPMSGLDPVLRRLAHEHGARGALAVQGLPGRHRLARPRDRAGGGAERPRRRALRARASRSRWRAASRRRWSRRAATPASCEAAVEAFHAGALRIYTSADPIGVEVGGAVKNVLAIATGIADGMQLGLNARAALVTRGLAEMTRLGVALGAEAQTFMGLSGLGDLVLTTTGDLSRNRTVGLRLAEGIAARAHPRRARPCRRGREQCADGAAARACPRHRDADRRRRRAGARRPARAGAGPRAAAAARCPFRARLNDRC